MANITRAYPPLPGEEIVISGVSGRFPSSRNIAEFSHNLYNKVSEYENVKDYVIKNVTLFVKIVKD